MSEVEGGTALAWRLLATLEGGSLLLATSALFAYTVRKKLSRAKRNRRKVQTVMLTDTTNILGKELKARLESHGCIVRLAPSGAAESRVGSDRVDALIIVGAHATAKPTSLEAIANLVSDDVYHNLGALQSLSPLVKQGGYIAWACAGTAEGSFRSAADAFDAVLEANLRSIAQVCDCEAVWMGRGVSVDRTAERVVNALLYCDTRHDTRFSIINTAHEMGKYVGRWLKNVT